MQPDELSATQPGNAAGENSVSKAEYARMKGLNKSTITRWAASGRLVLDDKGNVLVAESEARLAETADPAKEGVVARHEAQRGHSVQAQGRAPTDPERDSSYTKRIGESARREAALADMAEMDRDKQRGRLVEREWVERAVADSVVAARQALERLPDRLMLQLAAESDPERVYELLNQEIVGICQQISDLTGRLPELLTGTKQ